MILPICITIFYSISCFFAGWILIRRYYEKLNNPVYPFLASCFLLGEGILGYIWQFLGLMSHFNSSMIWFILIVIFFAGCWSIRNVFRGWFSEIFRSVSSLKFFPLHMISLTIIVSVLISFFLIGSVVAPVSGDSEAFYMTLPKIVAFSERLVPQRNYYNYSQIGLCGELQFAVLMKIATPLAAKCFVWVNAFCVGVFLLSICHYTGLGNKGMLISLVILLSSSVFSNSIFGGKVEIWGCAFGISAYYWALVSRNLKYNFIYMLIGMFAGLSIVARFSNLPSLFVCLMMIICINQYYSLKDDFDYKSGLSWNIVRRMFPALFLTCVFMFIAIIPHFIKNGILFHEPLSPFFFIGSKGDNWLNQSWYTYKDTIYILLTYPVALTFGLYPMQGGNISPLIIAFFPLFLLMEKPKDLLKNQLFVVTCAGILGVLVWMIICPSILAPRYIMATLFLLIPFAAKSAEYILERKTEFPVLAVIIYLSILFALFMTFKHYDSIVLGFNLIYLILFLSVNSFMYELEFFKSRGYLRLVIMLFLNTILFVFSVWLFQMRILPIAVCLIMVFFLLLISEKRFFKISENVRKYAVIILVFFSSLILIMPQSFIQLASFISGNVSELQMAKIMGQFHVNAVEYLNLNASKGDRIFISGYYSYYLRPDLLQCINGPEDGNMSSDNGWTYLFEHGFKYLLIQKSVGRDLLKDTVRPDWLSVEKTYSDAASDIYEIKSKGKDRKPEYRSIQLNSHVWNIVSDKKSN